MAKKAQKFSVGIYDKGHLKNLAKRLKAIEGILGASITEGCKIGMLSLFDEWEKEFYFKDYPEVEKKIDALMKKMHGSITTTIEEGDREAWLLSAQKNDALVDSLAKKTGITKEQIRKWKQPNLEALEAFQERKTQGMNLSERVWNLTDQFKQELEMALELGLGEGKSAAALSRDVRKYLNEPHKLFRRVKDKDGILRLSKAAKAYHPGRGVYRSSYKNALRLTATENNMAYRTADHNRWQQLDFVIGIEIKLSNNHNCKGIPKGAFRDICDTLAGRYPKDFKFVGWHPFCRCQATPILAPMDEFIEAQKEMLDGKKPEPFKQETEYPQQFQEWVKDNKQKLQTAKKLPYFVKDNSAVIFTDILHVDNPVKPGAKATPTIIDRAAQRHAARTLEEVQHIKQQWEERKKKYAEIEKDVQELNKAFAGISDKSIDAMQKAFSSYDYKAAEKAAAKLKKIKNSLDKAKWVENPYQQAAGSSLNEVLETEKEMADKMKKWQKKYGYKTFNSATLQHQLAKLEWEKHEAGSGFYKHPKFAEKVIDSHIAKTKDKIEIAQLVNKYNDFVKYKTLHAKTSLFDKYMKEMENAICSNDKEAMKKAEAKIENEQKKIEAAEKKAAAKKTQKSSHTPLKSPNKNVKIATNTDESGFFKEKNIIYTQDPIGATDYGIKYTNVLKNSIEEFAKTKKGSVFDAKDLEALSKCKSAAEIGKAVTNMRRKYLRNSSELRALQDITESVRKECEMQVRAVCNFTYGWDYEIRQIQCGNTSVVSRRGHTLKEMQERAESLERYIECAPKWNGGTTYRGMSLSNKELENIIEEFKNGEGNMLGSASWSEEKKVSMGFAYDHIGETSQKFGDKKENAVLLYTKKHKRATPIRHISEFQGEMEVLSSKDVRWKLVKDEGVKTIGGDDYRVIQVEPV